MGFIRDNAEFAIRNLLRKAAERAGNNVLHAIDHMDDGSPIALTITINRETGDAVFDFEGTGAETWSSLNAPKAVCSSAVIYCLRILCDEEIPLNAGCLAPIELKIPEGTILNPSETCADVAGNVCTSQRVPDVVLRCFEAVAASNGCSNNLTFGTSTFGYCELSSIDHLHDGAHDRLLVQTKRSQAAVVLVRLGMDRAEPTCT